MWLKELFCLLKGCKIIILILTLAFLLRIIGANPGYPPYHSDEGMSYSQGISILTEGTLNADGYGERFGYPNLIPLINAAAFKFIFIPANLFKDYLRFLPGFLNGSLKFPLAQYQQIDLMNRILGVRDVNVLFWGRYLAAIFGLGVVFLTYLLGKTVYDRNIGLLAAFLTAINYRQVLNSHFGLPDIYNAFFLILALLGCFRLIRRHNLKDYLLAAFLCGLSFSTKFQFFSLFTLAYIHLYLAISKRNSISVIKSVFDKKILVSGLLFLFTFIILDPYHLIYWKKTLDEVYNESLKYGAGHNTFYLYPYYYLYNLGIGRITSLLVVIGILIGLIRRWFQTVFLLLPVVFIFYLFTYYSTGGFYTRNFVTITPVLLIFAALAISELTLGRRYTLPILKLGLFRGLIFAVILGLLTLENLPNSVVVAKTYTKQWNFKLLPVWEAGYLPKGATVAAHSSVPLGDANVRLPYQIDKAFSLDEFRQEGADYAIANLDWISDEFYGWMRNPSVLQRWQKPNQELERTYPAMALRELEQFSVYSLINPWQAPDSDFIAAKIPQFNVLDKQLSYSFSGGGNDVWQSPVIPVDNWKGFVVEADMETDSKLPQYRDGFIAIKFYRTIQDARQDVGVAGIRLSRRNDLLNHPVTNSVAGSKPAAAKFMRVYFDEYDPAKAVSKLSRISVYQADIVVDYGGARVNPVHVDQDVIFPYSQGGL